MQASPLTTPSLPPRAFPYLHEKQKNAPVPRANAPQFNVLDKVTEWTDFFKTGHGLGRNILSKVDEELRNTFQIPQEIVNFELGKAIEKDRLVVLSLSYSFHTCCSLMKLVIALVWLSWGLCGSVVEHWSEKRDFRFLMRTQNCSVLFCFFSLSRARSNTN